MNPDSGFQSTENFPGLIFDPYNFRLNADESIGNDKCDWAVAWAELSAKIIFTIDMCHLFIFQWEKWIYLFLWPLQSS